MVTLFIEDAKAAARDREAIQLAERNRKRRQKPSSVFAQVLAKFTKSAAKKAG